MTPRVLAETPPGWVATEIARPKIAESAGATMPQWRAFRGPDDRSAFVSGCVATPIPGWVDDMRPAVEARTTALAGAAAERTTGGPMDARPNGHGSLDLRKASDLAGPVVGHARTFIGFDETHVFTCFVVCAARPPERLGAPATGEALGCERAVAESRLDGSAPPPRPGLTLRGVTWAVHNPRPAALAGGVLVVAAALLAVLTRRRPRFAR